MRFFLWKFVRSSKVHHHHPFFLERWNTFHFYSSLLITTSSLFSKVSKCFSGIMTRLKSFTSCALQKIKNFSETFQRQTVTVYFFSAFNHAPVENIFSIHAVWQWCNDDIEDGGKLQKANFFVILIKRGTIKMSKMKILCNIIYHPHFH